MKKIFIFAAVLALLTLSLNAQLKANKKGVVQPTTTTEKVDTPPDGYFRMGPSRASTTPVTPPYTNGFDSSTETNWWEVINANNDGNTYTWAFYSGRARYHWNSSSAANDWLVTAPVVLEAGKTYTFSINAWAETSSYPEQLEVKLASANTATALSAGTTVIASTQISSTSSTNTLSNQNVTVTTSGNYYFGIHAISARDMYYLNVDNLEIGVAAEPEHDLSIALSAPATAGAGNTVTLTATVTNTGDFDENGYTVTFTANGTTISTQNGGALAQGASATFTTTYTTDANASSVNFGASVACTDDADASNNNATASTSLVVLPPPENVAATASDNSGTMTWDAPAIESSIVTITEGFDDTNVYPSFSIGGITATQHTGTIGDWTVYTPSSDYVYGPQGVTFTNDNDPQAWTVFNPSIAGTSWTAHSGNQFMLSFCDAGDENGDNIQTTDHWLISPELSGNAQTITFFERVITTQYGSETYEVLASSTDKNPASFSLVQNITSNATTWTQRSVSLPAGTKYFAIRHTAYDIFGVMIDDVTYEGIVSSAPLPVSYNVYLEGQLVGNVDANTFSYTFNNLEDGTYNCAVSAVYDLGESAAVPTSFTIDTTNPTIEISPATQTINDAAAGALTVTGTDIDGNINVSAANNDWTVNPTSLGNTGGNVSVTYTGRDLSASTTVTASATGATDATATVDYVADVYIVGNFGSGWDFTNGTSMSYNNGTYTATLTVDAGNYILFARLLGNSNPWNTRDVFGPNSNGDWWMDADQKNGTIDLYDDDPIYFTEGGTYRITIDANNGTFTITKLNGEQTAQPVISSAVSADGQYVTITATGDGTITLNVPGYDPVIGENGEASITIPCGVVSNTITVSATAQESGKDESDPTYRDITIPAGSDWVEMDGTYDNPNDLLSFLKNNEDIMMVDQFAADTKNNSHPDHYTYTLRQTVNGETTTSTPVSIPVYKTSSTMQGLYTQNQVTGDTDMKLKPNVVNTEMDYEVNPDRNVLYYSLYRGEKNAYYPEITADSRISQLQKFEEMVNGQVQYFMFENHQEGVAPKYDHVGNELVERLDTNWVEAAYNDNVAYVPVIWTFGLYTARGDGKNNSYGSDIKREYMGQVTANITGQISQGVYGTWEDVNGTTYRAFHPTIVATGYLPQNDNNNAVNYNDGDVAHYVPYLCRAWCTNEGIHDYGRDADGQLTDLGELPTPFLVGEATFGDDMTATIGGDWTQGSVRDPWSFGLPASVTESQVTFKIRFYYKKVVTEGQQNGGNGKFIGGAAEEFFMAETEGDANDMVVGINEFMNGIVPVSVTYVNPQGMQSSRPFDGVNIVVTRYSDGTTRTSKIIR